MQVASEGLCAGCEFRAAACLRDGLDLSRVHAALEAPHGLDGVLVRELHLRGGRQQELDVERHTPLALAHHVVGVRRAVLVELLDGQTQ